MDDYIEELESVIIDLLFGKSPSDIESFNNISDERAMEIYKLKRQVINNYSEKHSIKIVE